MNALIQDSETANQGLKPRLVRIIARLNVGGPAQQACMLHEKLSPAYETYIVIGSLAPGESDMSYLLGSERNVLRLPDMSRKISFVGDCLAFWRIFGFLRKVRPAVVHTHTAKAGALGRLAAWMAGVPVIVHTYHGHIFHGYFNRLYTRLFIVIERMLARASTGIIAISKSQLEELSDKYRVAPRKKIWLVHNGFDLSRFVGNCRERARKDLAIHEDEFVVVWAGRMVPIKGVELLAAAIRKAAACKARFRFLIVGEGTERAKLESLLEGCTNFRLLGWRNDMETIWSAADAALLTSRNEGTPTALIEAMAAGVPFVSTNVGGVQDVAVGEFRELPQGFGIRADSGFLTPQNPEALLYCLERLAENPQDAAQMASAGRAFVLERFSVERLVSELTDLYHSLLDRGGSVSGPSVHQSKKEGSPPEDAFR